MILLNDSGQLILGTVDRERFEEIGRADLLSGDICWTQPTLIRGRVFLRNHQRAICVYLGDPKLINAEDNSLRTSDITPRSGIDWANLVFSVEPEYAMDAPTNERLCNWFIAILVTGSVVAWGAAIIFGSLVIQLRHLFKNFTIRKPVNQTTIGSPISKVNSGPAIRYLRRLIAILLGVIGTTLYSHWQGAFVFTWPLTVFVFFEICIYEAQLKRSKSKVNPWPGRIAFLTLFVSIAAYYLLCRRLSLAFEWAFLTGFPFSVPFLLLARKQLTKSDYRSQFMEWFWWTIALITFYWAGAGLILWKY